MSKHSTVNFVHVEENSQFYTDLEQIKTSLQYDFGVKDFILVGIINTIAKGYKLTPPPTPIQKRDYLLYQKGKKPILCQLRFIKDGIYHICHVDGSKWIKTTDLSKFIKWVPK